MDKKILLIFGLVAVAAVLFGCTQDKQYPVIPQSGDINIDTAAIDQEINSSDSAIDTNISDVPDVQNINSSDISTASTQGPDVVIDDAALAASIDASDAQINSMSDFSTLDAVSAPDLSAQ